MKERVTVTIEQQLLKVIDSTVDGVQIKNRSHAIEVLVQKAMQNQLPRIAVVLAGGDSKKLLRVINGQSVLSHNLSLLEKHGVQEAVILINKNDDRLQNHLQTIPNHSMRISVVEEHEPLGTAGGLLSLKDCLTEPFIVINGDELKDVDIKDMYAFHKQNKGVCTIALTTTQDPSSYGVVVLNGNTVVAFIEKPQGKTVPSNLISAGFYIAQPSLLDYIPKGYAKLEIDVFPKLAKQELLIGYPFSGQYLDVQGSVTSKLAGIWSGFR